MLKITNNQLRNICYRNI